MKKFKEWVLNESKFKVGDTVKEIEYPLEIGIIKKVKGDMYVVDNGDGLVGRSEDEIAIATEEDFNKLEKMITPAKKKKKKKGFFEKLKGMFEEVSTSTVSGGGGDVMAPLKVTPDGRAFGMDYFEVDCVNFEKCRTSMKKKFKHWKKLLQSDNIQKYAKENKNAFLIKREGSNDYLRAR